MEAIRDPGAQTLFAVRYQEALIASVSPSSRPCLPRSGSGPGAVGDPVFELRLEVPTASVTPFG